MKGNGPQFLRRFLNRTGMNSDDFGNWMTPKVSGRTVRRWLAGKSIPSAPQIAEIHRLTKGDVRFEDWYPVPKVSNAAEYAP